MFIFTSVQFLKSGGHIIFGSPETGAFVTAVPSFSDISLQRSAHRALMLKM